MKYVVQDVVYRFIGSDLIRKTLFGLKLTASLYLCDGNYWKGVSAVQILRYMMVSFKYACNKKLMLLKQEGFTKEYFFSTVVPQT